jgi:hypothetical protein
MDSLELVCPQISMSKKSIEEINCACACIPFLVTVLGISSSHDHARITFLVFVHCAGISSSCDHACVTFLVIVPGISSSRDHVMFLVIVPGISS